MTRSATWFASAAVLALTAGITSPADVSPEFDRPLPPGSFLMAENAAGDVGQPEENAEESAKMGKEEGSHEAAQPTSPPKSDSDKMDQAGSGSTTR